MLQWEKESGAQEYLAFLLPLVTVDLPGTILQQEPSTQPAVTAGYRGGFQGWATYNPNAYLFLKDAFTNNRAGGRIPRQETGSH